MKRFGIAGVGIIGPGIGGWRDAVPVLTGRMRFDAQADVPQAPSTNLPANERRRLSPLIRMVLQCCEDTLAECSADYPTLCSVFATSCGDLTTVDKILTALASPHKPVSPTLFHNSVHNAPSGYWSIARANQMSSISLSTHDFSFSAGLLNAISLVASGEGPTLLIAYDCVAPSALAPFRPFLASFATGLLIVEGPARWSISIDIRKSARQNVMDDPALDAIRLGNPAARSLPLLAQLAAGVAGTLTLPYLDDIGIDVDVRD